MEIRKMEPLTEEDNASHILVSPDGMERYRMACDQMVLEFKKKGWRGFDPGIESLVLIDDEMWVAVPISPTQMGWHKLSKSEWRWLD